MHVPGLERSSVYGILYFFFKLGNIFTLIHYSQGCFLLAFQSSIFSQNNKILVFSTALLVEVLQ